MAITVIQAPEPSYGVSSGTTRTYTGLSALTIGDDVIAGCVLAAPGETISSVTLGGQAMTLISGASVVGTESGATVALYRRTVTGAESGQDIVATYSGSDPNAAPFFGFVIRGASATQVAATDSYASLPGPFDVGPVTPTLDDHIVIALTHRGNRAWTDDGGWTTIGTPANRYAMVYDINTSITARTLTLTPDVDGFLDGVIVAIDGVIPDASTGLMNLPKALRPYPFAPGIAR